MKNVDSLYLRWLKSVVTKNYHVEKPYHELLAYLFSRNYTPSFRDISRYNDGVEVRLHFCEERPKYQTIDFMERPCSIFEMILGLSFRLKSMTMSSREPSQTGFWFWTMVKNMGLLEYDDEHYDENAVDKIVTDFMNGSYSSDGTGGLFIVDPAYLKGSVGDDMTQIDIWSQAMLYVNTQIL